MKLKQSPADFRVEELSHVAAGGVGEFSLYRLTKTGWTTPDAIGQVRRRWALDAGRIGYGGLKDRHAVTSQFLTVFRGPHTNLDLQNVRLEYLGRVPAHFRSEDIRANRFTVVVRHLTPGALEAAQVAAEAVGRAGVPNYFDDQRFGSVSRDHRFVAREMLRGDFEAALKLALAEPYEHDRAPAKSEKSLLRDKWGDWATLKAELPRGHARSLIDYLRQHPADFKGAVARLRPELGGLYLAAYQSYVWNKLLDRWLRDRLPADVLDAIHLSVGDFAAPTGGDPEILAAFEALNLPLPSARLKESSPELDAVLAGEGLTLAAMRVPGLQKPFFSKGERPACVKPAAMTATPGDDELNPGRRTLTLSFELPRGAYATMVVKRVTA